VPAPNYRVSVPTDLFAAAAATVIAQTGPLAERMRPRTFDDVVGHPDLVGPGGTLRRLLDAPRLPSMVFWGPAGSGKTTLARLVTDGRGDVGVQLSATNATVADLRRTIAEAIDRLGADQRRTIVFLDEIHRFTRTQQDALLPAVEAGQISLIGATTESPWATIVGPLLSRCTVFRLEPLGELSISSVVDRAASAEDREVDGPARDLIQVAAGGDARAALTVLDMAIALAEPGATIGAELVRSAMGAGDIRYGTGAHYDSASAFIKWMRHSNPAQAVAWMVHMLEAGEDPRFVARRMCIFASEDIGPADPRALLVADAAARAVDSVGMPEARYILGQAAGYLARAPKSRAVVDDLEAALDTRRVLPPELGGPDLEPAEGSA